MHGFFDLLVLVLEFNNLGINEQAEPIRTQGPAKEVFGFLMQFLQQLVHLLGRVTQAQALERAPGGIETASPHKDVAQ